jgi:hypothetical protein
MEPQQAFPNLKFTTGEAMRARPGALPQSSSPMWRVIRG